MKLSYAMDYALRVKVRDDWTNVDYVRGPTVDGLKARGLIETRAVKKPPPLTMSYAWEARQTDAGRAAIAPKVKA